MRGLFAVLVAVAGVGAVVPAAGAARSPICTRGLTTVEVDPRGLLPLTGTNPIAAATTAALRREKRSSKPQVVGAVWAPRDRERGGEAKTDCGTRVWKRTVVVYVTLRALLPSQSLSQNVFFVGRFKGGYRVWQVVH
jgi:hypothetical protein